MADGKKIQFIAELSINHLGMVNIAKAMIKSAKEAGASFIKIKIKDVGNYYERSKKWRNYDFKLYRKSLELSIKDIEEINRYCKKLKIKWFSTIHDKYGLEVIKKYKPPFYKIASMDGKNTELFDLVLSQCKKDKVPLIYSTGGENKNNLENIIDKVKKNKIKTYLLHTVSVYPTPRGHSNINYIDKLIEKYSSEDIKIGYSGHEEGYAATLLASRKNILMIERHITLSRNYKIHHIDAALLPNEYKNMVDLVYDMYEEDTKIVREISKKESDFLNNKKYS